MKKLISMLGHEKYKMSLEHLYQKARKCLINDGYRSRGYKSQLEGAQIGKSLRIKMIVPG